MEAAAGGHDAIVRTLLEAGTPWNAIDKEGNCAGDLAVAAEHESTAEILLEAGRQISLAQICLTAAGTASVTHALACPAHCHSSEFTILL